MRITDVLLQPAAPCIWQIHSQRHETGANRVVRGLMLAARDVNHVEHEGRESEAITKLFDNHAGADHKQIFGLRIRKPDEHGVRQMNRQHHRPQPEFQAVPRNSQATHQTTEQQRPHAKRPVNPTVLTIR